nr:MAG TPA: hypothetical protein [Caudoviricetes sp.]
METATSANYRGALTEWCTLNLLNCWDVLLSC